MILEHMIEKLTRVCWTKWSVGRCVESGSCESRHSRPRSWWLWEKRIGFVGLVGPFCWNLVISAFKITPTRGTSFQKLSGACLVVGKTNGFQQFTLQLWWSLRWSGICAQAIYLIGKIWVDILNPPSWVGISRNVEKSATVLKRRTQPWPQELNPAATSTSSSFSFLSFGKDHKYWHRLSWPVTNASYRPSCLRLWSGLGLRLCGEEYLGVDLFVYNRCLSGWHIIYVVVENKTEISNIWWWRGNLSLASVIQHLHK